MGHITGLIFCLDLGIATGFAKGRPGDVPVSGTVRLKKPSESIDVAFANLDWFLRGEFDAERPALVVKEKMLSLQAYVALDNGEKTVRAHAAYHGTVELICVQYGILWDDVADSTVRRHFIGIGRTGERDETKRAVVARCHQLSLMPADCHDSDRADALATHDWACANFGSRSASISNFALFDQGGKKRA